MALNTEGCFFALLASKSAQEISRSVITVKYRRWGSELAFLIRVLPGQWCRRLPACSFITLITLLNWLTYISHLAKGTQFTLTISRTIHNLHLLLCLLYKRTLHKTLAYSAQLSISLKSREHYVITWHRLVSPIFPCASITHQVALIMQSWWHYLTEPLRSVGTSGHALACPGHGPQTFRR